MAAQSSRGLRYVSATKRIGKPKPKKKPTKNTRKVDSIMENPKVSDNLKDKAAVKSTKEKSTIKGAKTRVSKKEKPAILKPPKAEVSWFVIASENGKLRVVTNGSQTECLDIIVANAGTPGANMFLANGFKILGN